MTTESDASVPATPVFAPLLDRQALREGLLICRRRPGLLAAAIMMATAARRFRIPSDAWNHDAIIVRDPADGELKVGDALMGPGCVLTPLSEWERDCVENGTRLIVLQVEGAGDGIERAAAKWWLDNVWGSKYDKVAIWRLGLKWIFGDWFSGKVGLLSHFFCTEGVRDAYAAVIRAVRLVCGGVLEDPWGSKANPTPGTTRKRWKEGRLTYVGRALTPEGRAYSLAE
jgi:hypothetical protein